MGLAGNATWSSDLVRFALVGAIGFTLDAGVLTILVSWFGVNVYASRAASFGIAVLATWRMNRGWVFERRNALRSLAVGAEYLRYLLVQILGAFANLGVFVAALKVAPELITHPVIPLAIGAGAGLLVNYAGARVWVFARPAVR